MITAGLVGTALGIGLMACAMPYLFCYFVYRLFGGKKGLFTFFRDN